MASNRKYRIKRLTRRFIATVKKPGMYADHCNGLNLEVKPSGSKSWVKRYKRKGEKPRHMGLGSYSLYDLEQARELARKHTQEIREGLDPIDHRIAQREAERKAREVQEIKAITVEDILLEYLRRKAKKWYGKTPQTIERRIKKHFLSQSAFANLPVEEVRPAHIEAVIEPIKALTPDLARHCVGYLYRAFEIARAKDWRTAANPASKVALEELLEGLWDHEPTNLGKLPYWEVPAFMKWLATPLGEPGMSLTIAEASAQVEIDRSEILRAIHDNRIRARRPEGGRSDRGSKTPWIIEPADLYERYPRKNFATIKRPQFSLTQFLLRFSILTATRPAEARYMTWDELNHDDTRWTMQWFRTKEGKKMKPPKRPRVTPLSLQARQIIHFMRTVQNETGPASRFVFAHSPAFFLGTGAHAKTGQPMSEQPVRDLIYKRFHDRIDRGESITAHGTARGSFSAWANDQGKYSHETIEMALGHILGNVTSRAYNDAERIVLRLTLFNAWGAYATGPEPIPADVVPLRA
jgi:integrase